MTPWAWLEVLDNTWSTSVTSKAKEEWITRGADLGTKFLNFGKITYPVSAPRVIHCSFAFEVTEGRAGGADGLQGSCDSV